MKEIKSEDLEELKKNIEEGEAVKVIKELELQKGETYLGELKDGDKFQVLLRHLQVIEQSLFALANGTNLMLSNIQTLLETFAKKQGLKIEHKK